MVNFKVFIYSVCLYIVCVIFEVIKKCICHWQLNWMLNKDKYYTCINYFLEINWLCNSVFFLQEVHLNNTLIKWQVVFEGYNSCIEWERRSSYAHACIVHRYPLKKLRYVFCLLKSAFLKLYCDIIFFSYLQYNKFLGHKRTVTLLWHSCYSLKHDHDTNDCHIRKVR
jgi:hypothetical protein